MGAQQSKSKSNSIPASSQDLPGKPTPASSSHVSSSSPSSLIDLLPGEILSEIILYLDFPDQARLAICSALLYRRLRPFTWDDPCFQAEIMLYVCRYGDMELLEHAARYDAVRSSVRLSPYPSMAQSTLFLAISKPALPAVFDCLLQAGATFAYPGHEVSFNQLARFFGCEERISYLYRCLDMGCSALKEQVLGYLCDRLIVHFIMYNVSLPYLKMMLEFNPSTANHSRTVLCGKQRRSSTPLGMAIQQQRTDIFNLLLEHGADIDGRIMWGHKVSRSPPIFAAIYIMIEKQDTSFFVKLVDLEADLNVWGYLDELVAPKQADPALHHPTSMPVTPVLFYLLCKSAWAVEANHDSKSKSKFKFSNKSKAGETLDHPVEILTHMYDHGASFDPFLTHSPTQPAPSSPLHWGTEYGMWHHRRWQQAYKQGVHPEDIPISWQSMAFRRPRDRSLADSVEAAASKDQPLEQLSEGRQIQLKQAMDFFWSQQPPSTVSDLAPLPGRTRRFPNHGSAMVWRQFYRALLDGS